MSVISGFTGLFRPPCTLNMMHGVTMFIATDDLHQELNLIVLSPGFYNDAFNIASFTSYQYINIFMPSTGTLFISDLFRLVTDLQCLKKSVKWIFPEKYTTAPQNVPFEMSQFCNNLQVSDKMMMAVEYSRKDIEEGVPLYDMSLLLTDGPVSTRYLFSLYMTESKLDACLADSSYDTICFPYNGTLYGGTTCRRQRTRVKRELARITPILYNSKDEYTEALCSNLWCPARRNTLV